MFPGLVELPAYAVCIYAVYRLGRRPPIIFTMIGAGASCLLTMAFEKGIPFERGIPGADWLRNDLYVAISG